MIFATEIAESGYICLMEIKILYYCILLLYLCISIIRTPLILIMSNMAQGFIKFKEENLI